jgi:hypothetical protein
MRRSEAIIILTAAFLFLLGSILYWSDFPLSQYLFHLRPSNDKTTIGTIKTAQPFVRRESVGELNFNQIQSGASVFDQDFIMTPNDTSARVTFKDGSYIELAPNSLVRLNFENDFSLSGVSHQTNVEVIQGDVSGESKTQSIILKKGAEKLALVEKPHPVPPKPKPTPSPSVLPPPKFVLTQPSPQASFAVPPLSVKPEFSLAVSWQMTPLDPLIQLVLSDSKTKKTILEQSIRQNSPSGKLALTLKKPGQYHLAFHRAGIHSELMGETDFSLSPSFEGIQLKKALVSGEETQNNRLMKKLNSLFFVTLNWETYADLKFYEVELFKKPNGSSPFWRNESDSNHLDLNKDNVFSGDLYYRVQGRTPNGFTVRSPIQKFHFDFFPPIHSNPEDRSSFSKKKLMEESNQILITWQKTCFTEEYILQIAPDPEFKTLLADYKTKENFFVIRDPKLGQYYWRLQSVAKNGKTSPQSTATHFSVVP